MIGEQINEALSQWMKNGIASGSLRSDIPILPTVFLFWASLSGLIQMAENKQTYFEQAMGISKRAFLEQGFQTLYRAIAKEDGV